MVPLYKGFPPKQIGSYYLYEKVGEGSWGKVRRCLDPQSRPFACKIYYQCVVQRKLKDGINRLRREFEMLKSFHHSAVVKYYEMFETEDKIYVILEWCGGGSVEQWISKSVCTSDALKVVMFDLLSAVDALSLQGIAHHDIKPANLLLTDIGRVKLSDFGVAERLSAGKAYSQYGTPSYQAPEVFNDREVKGYNGEKADLWSCGVVLYQLVHRTLPWKGETVYLVMREIASLTDVMVDEPMVIEKYGGDVLLLLKFLLKVNPQERPSARTLLNTHFPKRTSCTVQ